MNLKWKKPLAMLLVVCMLLTILPVAAFAEGNEVAQIDDTKYSTLQAAVNTAGTTPSTITLLKDTTENITIGENQEITLNLNGCTLTNQSGHTITNNGTLTIKGNGTVDNVTHAKAALWNNATVTLNGGNFTRSQENGQNSSDNGGNSYYAVVNHGTMEINAGVSVTQNGQYSSLLENGWYNGNQNTSKTASVLTINGGTFSGGLNTIKNDDYGNLTINGGEFKNVAQAALLNWNVANVAGGTFESGKNAILNGQIDGTMDKGELTITGGTFKAGDGAAIAQMDSDYNFGTIKISGGNFSTEKGSAIIGDIAATKTGDIQVSGGTYNIAPKTDYVAEGYARIKQANGTYQVGTPSEDMVKDENGIYFENENLAQDGNVAVVDGTYYSTLSAAISAASESATVKLIADVTESVTIDSGKDIVLDLNGKTLTGKKDTAGKMLNVVTNFGTLRIKDSSAFGSGTILGGADSGQANNVGRGGIALVNSQNATCILESGNIKRGDNGTFGNYTVKNEGTMQIVGGTISNNSNTSSMVINLNQMEISGGILTQDSMTAVKNDTGTLKITGNAQINSANNQALQNWDTVSMDGGILNGYVTIYTWEESEHSAVLDITGGIITGKAMRAINYNGGATKPPIVIISGSAKICVEELSTIDGSAITKDKSKAEICVKGGSYAESVNSNYLDPSLNAELKSVADTKTPYSYYASVDAALAAAQPGDTVTDLTVTGDNKCTLIFDAAEGKLDFVGQSITVASGTEITLPTVSRSGYTFAGWYAGDTLAGTAGDNYPVTGDVTLTAKWNRNTSSGSSGSGGFSGTYNYPVKVDSTGDATVTLDKNYAVAGDQVTITVQPKSGKAVDEVIVTDKDNKEITVTKVGDNKYSFTMPSGQVKVAVTTKAAAYDKRIVLQINNRNVLINSTTFANDVAPVIVDNRTMVPIRVITEALGGRADWNAASQTVALTIDGSVLRMTIGQTIAGFDAAPVILNDRTYVPIRYVAEKLGANVEWIANTQQIIIEK